jgi:peptide/nickel transport system substrate-binding protein
MDDAGARRGTHRAHRPGPWGARTGAAGNFVDNFNPFSPEQQDPTRGMLYEPLYFFDTADAARKTPWLATSYAFSNAGKTLTFDLRKGVEWSDGTPFTSADVAFTVNLIRSSTALNAYGLPITSAAAEGAYKVVLDFSKPVYSDIDYIAGQTYMLPEHIWKNVKDPATFLNQDPVGTGGYEVSKVTAEVMDLTANPHYYMPGLPKFKTIEFLSFKGNTSSDLAIEDGQVDWAGNYIPEIKKNYLAKSSEYKLSDIPLGTGFLVTNDKTGPTASVAVRKAISDAIDRTTISDEVYQDYASPTNPEALLTPNFSSVIEPSLKGATLTYSVADAKKTLEPAGYKMGSNGVFDSPSGKPLDLSVQVIDGYTDYVQSLQLIVPELQQAGIDLSVDAESSAQFVSNQDTGNFQMLIEPIGYTPGPYVCYNELLNGSNVPAIGKTDTFGVHDEPMSPDGPKLAVHQKAVDGQDKLARGLAAHLPAPAGFDAWHWATSLNQARAVAFAIERWRSIDPPCRGMVVWQLNDCWPAISWAAVDGDGRRKPLWYALRRVFADRLLTLQPLDEGATELVAVNDGPAAWSTTVRLTRQDFEGRVMRTGAARLHVPAGGRIAVRLDEELATAGDPRREVLVAAADGLEAFRWWAEDRELELPAAAPSVTVTERPGGWDVRVHTDVLLKDLALLADKVDPDARVDDMLVTVRAGRSVTFHVDGRGVDPAALGGPTVLRSANQLVARPV